MSLIINGQITKHYQVNKEYYLLEFNASELAKIAQPGQFLHVKCSSTTDPLLRRPISIHNVNRQQGTVRLLYKVAGRGTELLSTKQSGEYLDVMGPLGNGFNLTNKERVLVVAGGIGAAPLLFLVQELVSRGIAPDVFIGSRSANDLLAVADIEKLGVAVKTATDDGSAGYKGVVTELLTNQLDNVDMIYTCGPAPMMKAVAMLAKEYNIPAEVSLEERMGCGVGACLACTCKIKVDNGSTYKRVCADGPVFNAEEVVWHD